MIVFINAQDFEWDLFPFFCCSYLGPFLQGSWNPLWTWRKPQLLYVETDNTSEGKCMAVHAWLMCSVLVKCWSLLLNSWCRAMERVNPPLLAAAPGAVVLLLTGGWCGSLYPMKIPTSSAEVVPGGQSHSVKKGMWGWWAGGDRNGRICCHCVQGPVSILTE